jgi:hypothetical protein
LVALVFGALLPWWLGLALLLALRPLWRTI